MTIIILAVPEDEVPTSDKENAVAITPVDTSKPLDPPKYEVRPLLGERYDYILVLLK